jgi:hypothetical protein
MEHGRAHGVRGEGLGFVDGGCERCGHDEPPRLSFVEMVDAAAMESMIVSDDRHDPGARAS